MFVTSVGGVLFGLSETVALLVDGSCGCRWGSVTVVVDVIGAIDATTAVLESPVTVCG